jgi:hypothetical protein
MQGVAVREWELQEVPDLLAAAAEVQDSQVQRLGKAGMGVMAPEAAAVELGERLDLVVVRAEV